jgi:type VII secretion integral membrane protein EccD
MGGITTLTTSSRSELCPVAVMAPDGRVDVVLPGDVPLADLLPAVARWVPGLVEAGVGHGGWALQRLGEPPLDSSRTLGALGVRRGELLYLRPSQDLIPELSYDDAADAIATSRRETEAWNSDGTRACVFAVTTALIVLGAVVLALSRARWTVLLDIAVTAAVLLLATAGFLSRAAADAQAGTIVGLCAVPYAAIASAAAYGSDSAHVAWSSRLVVGCTAVVLASVLAVVIVGAAGSICVAPALAGLCGVVGFACGLVTSSALAGGAAVAMAIAILLMPMCPMLAFRLARLPMPFVPLNPRATQVTEDMPGSGVLEQATVARDYLSGLVTGIAVISGVAAVFCAWSPGWAGATVDLLVAGTLLLRMRHFTGRLQRSMILAAGMSCAVTPLLELALRAGAVGRTWVAALLTLVGVLVIALGLLAPGRRTSPYWGRCADLLEITVLVAVAPVVLQLLGVYGRFLSHGQ